MTTGSDGTIISTLPPNNESIAPPPTACFVLTKEQRSSNRPCLAPCFVRAYRTCIARRADTHLPTDGASVWVRREGHTGPILLPTGIAL
jgi:hypothetical protein